jgi:hypothetical protein
MLRSGWMLRVQEVSLEEVVPQSVSAEMEAAAPAPLMRSRLSPTTVLALQRLAGNQAVVQLLRQQDARGAAAGQDVGGAQSAATSSAGGDQQGAGAGADDGGDVKLPPITIPAQDPVSVEVYAAGPKLEGKTTASYTSTDPLVAPNPPKASKAPGGIRAQGTVSSTFSSNPTVDPYDLDGHGFTDCQRKNAEKFIKQTLDPHEQQHVSAFKTNFDGNWSKPFDLTVKDADDATGQIKGIYDTEFAARKKKADDASADLDSGGKNNFVWDMDEGCDGKDKPAP